MSRSSLLAGAELLAGFAQPSGAASKDDGAATSSNGGEVGFTPLQEGPIQGDILLMRWAGGEVTRNRVEGFDTEDKEAILVRVLPDDEGAWRSHPSPASLSPPTCYSAAPAVARWCGCRVTVARPDARGR